MHIFRTNHHLLASGGRLRTVLALGLLLFLGACGSPESEVSAQPPATTVEDESESADSSTTTEGPVDETVQAPTAETVEIQRIESVPPAPTLDESRSFSRAVQPFDGDPFAVLLDGEVAVRDRNSGDLLATHPFDLAAFDADPLPSVDGAVYIDTRSEDQIRFITRIDAGGIESLAIVSLTTCESLAGEDACPSHDEGDFDDADLYIPSGALNYFLVDTDAGSVTELAIGASNLMAVLPLDSGWLGISLDDAIPQRRPKR